MLTPIRRRLTYANVMSSIAVFVVLGGGAYATIDRKIETQDLRNGAVTPKKIDKGAVRTNKLQRRAVGTGKIKPQAVGVGKLKEPAVSTPKVFDGAITTAKLGDGAVNSEKVGEIVKRVGSTVVPNNANGTANATCLGGERLLSGGGGFLGGEMDAQVSFSGQVGGAGNWRVHARNESGAPQTLEAQVHCLQ